MQLNSLANYLKKLFSDLDQSSAHQALNALGFKGNNNGAFKTVFIKSGCEFVVKTMEADEYENSSCCKMELDGYAALNRFRASQSQVFKGGDFYFIFQEKLETKHHNHTAMMREYSRVKNEIKRKKLSFYADLHNKNCGVHRQRGVMFFDGL